MTVECSVVLFSPLVLLGLLVHSKIPPPQNPCHHETLSAIKSLDAPVTILQINVTPCDCAKESSIHSTLSNGIDAVYLGRFLPWH